MGDSARGEFVFSALQAFYLRLVQTVIFICEVDRVCGSCIDSSMHTLETLNMLIQSARF